MITFEYVKVMNLDSALRGMRNPKDSWAQSDSNVLGNEHVLIGPKDMTLAKKLAEAGPEHGKFLRQIFVSMDIVAPMYWWAEFDTYKVGTTRDSCSKMHRLLAKPFEVSDFSFDQSVLKEEFVQNNIVDILNELRNTYMILSEPERKKAFWYTILELLPCSYNQRSTVTMNYAVLRNIYRQRHDHKLQEWHEFCDMIAGLPYAQELLVT